MISACQVDRMICEHTAEKRRLEEKYSQMLQQQRDELLEMAAAKGREAQEMARAHGEQVCSHLSDIWKIILFRYLNSWVCPLIRYMEDCFMLNRSILKLVSVFILKNTSLALVIPL
jgi:hypothetical protein